MSWISDATSAIGWLAAEALGGSPQQLQQGFQQLGVSVEDFVSWYGYQQSQMPAPGGVITPAGAQGMGQWLTTAPAAPAGQKPAAPAQAQGAAGAKPANMTSAQWTTVQAVIKAADEMGVPRQLALAIAWQESKFDPGAQGDSGCSFGVMQLNTCGGEGEGLPDYVLNDPYLNAKVSLQQVQQVMRQNPNASMGQIAAMAQRPADPQGYASSIMDWVDQVQTGAPNTALGGLNSLVTGGRAALQRQLGGNSAVPIPFPKDFFSQITESFGEDGEQGTDFGMREGVPIKTPVGGTIETRDDGSRNWGRAVYVHMPNGWTYFVGHMKDFAVEDGETVSPDSVLGTSGGGPESPSPGNSTGPHIEVRFIDPAGRNQDPMPFLQQAFSGTTFAQWAGGLFLGSAQVLGEAQDIHRTPDGRIVDLNTQVGQWYASVDNVWRSVFGVRAPLQAALDFRASGVQTIDDVRSSINNLPSNILSGMSIGAFQSLTSTVDRQAQASLGRPVPQSLVKQLAQQGITSPAEVRLWFDGHSSSDIPPEDYARVFDQANPYTQGIWGDYPHPSDIWDVWQQSGGATPAPQQAAPPPIGDLPVGTMPGVF